MSKEYKECVADTFSWVIENVAMFFSDRAEPDEVEVPDGETYLVTLNFGGAGRGVLRLMASAEAAAEVASNVLGVQLADESDEDALDAAMDALKELVNVTVGHILPEVGGKSAVFDLSPPELQPNISNSEWQEFLDDECTVAFLADDYPMLVNFEFEEYSLAKASETT